MVAGSCYMCRWDRLEAGKAGGHVAGKQRCWQIRGKPSRLRVCRGSKMTWTVSSVSSGIFDNITTVTAMAATTKRMLEAHLSARSKPQV